MNVTSEESDMMDVDKLESFAKRHWKKNVYLCLRRTEPLWQSVWVVQVVLNCLRLMVVLAKCQMSVFLFASRVEVVIFTFEQVKA